MSAWESGDEDVIRRMKMGQALFGDFLNDFTAEPIPDPGWTLHWEFETEFVFRTEGIPDWDRVVLDVSRKDGILTVHQLAVTRSNAPSTP